MIDADNPKVDAPQAGEARVLSPEARRALAEAEARRQAAAAATVGSVALSGPGADTREVGGRNGPDPVRYGDWEKGGIVSDF